MMRNRIAVLICLVMWVQIIHAQAHVTSYKVNLTCQPPTSSPDPVAGYAFFRSTKGLNSYSLLGNSGSCAYSDMLVQMGSAYDYIAKSFDASGVYSVPSNTTTAAIPGSPVTVPGKPTVKFNP